jgi:nucleotide-binding universal stress UspA family protein
MPELTIKHLDHVFWRRDMKYSSRRILIGVEDSESSIRVLEYVADLVRDSSEFDVHVFHAVGPVPLELREFGGAENPQTEAQLDSQLHQKRDHWIRAAKSEAHPLLENARLQLSALGSQKTPVTTHLIVLQDTQDFIGEILKTASKNRCGTIVVGQSSFPWFKELFASHTSEELLKQSKDFAICVVH